MLEVYDKKLSTDGLMEICWIASIPCILCSAFIFLNFSNEQIGQSFLLKTLSLLIAVPAGLIGILRIFESAKLHGPIGETSYLRVKDDSISFLNRKIGIGEIESITIRIRNKKIEDYFSGNNYLEIKTRSDKHQLGLLIGGEKGIYSVEQLCRTLRQRGAAVIYENYV